MKFYTPHINGYRQYLLLERGLSENSIKAYTSDVIRFFEIIDENLEISSIQSIDSQHIQSFLAEIHNLGLSRRTQARFLSSLKSFFLYLFEEGSVVKDPTELIEGPKLEQKIPEVLSYEEINQMLEAIDMSDTNGHRNRAIVETLYACGLRVSELVNLTLSGFYPEEGFVRVVGKNDKERLIPIGDSACKHILLYLKNVRNQKQIAKGHEDFIFLNRSGKQLTRVMIFHIIKNLSQLAGIKKNVSPHTFRHSFATHLVEGGANLRAVQDMLGHESIITTEIYTHLDTSYLKETIMNFHPKNQST